MEEHDLKEMASQLRKPLGDLGIQIGELMNEGNVQVNYEALKILNASNNDAILEVGMGNGYFVSEILEKNPKVKYTGCDISETMITEAVKNNDKWVKNKQAQFILGNINALPFPDESFDKVITINTTYFWDDTSLALSELKRVVKPKGSIIITLRPKRQMANYPFTKYGFRLMSKEEAVSLFEKNGLKIFNVIENKEPPFDLVDERLEMENLIFVTGKNQHTS